jgi:hypothetical protein
VRPATWEWLDAATLEFAGWQRARSRLAAGEQDDIDIRGLAKEAAVRLATGTMRQPRHADKRTALSSPVAGG